MEYWRVGKVERRWAHIVMPLNKYGGVNYTLKQIKAMTIQCANCGSPIFIGDDAVLKCCWGERPLPAGAKVYTEGKMRLAVQCAGCLDTVASVTGMWQPDPHHPGTGYLEPKQSKRPETAVA